MAVDVCSACDIADAILAASISQSVALALDFCSSLAACSIPLDEICEPIARVRRRRR